MRYVCVCVCLCVRVCLCLFVCVRVCLCLSVCLKITKKIALMSHRLAAAFRSQRQWTRIFLSLTAPMAMGTQIGFKRHRESHYLSQCSRKLRFRHYYL